MKKKINNDFYAIYKKWDMKKGIIIATKLGIHLKKNHWKIIFFMRKFYQKYNTIPKTRMLIFFLKKKYHISLNSQDLFLLFKSTPMKNISKIAGLPKPSSCL